MSAMRALLLPTALPLLGHHPAHAFEAGSGVLSRDLAFGDSLPQVRLGAVPWLPLPEKPHLAFFSE